MTSFAIFLKETTLYVIIKKPCRKKENEEMGKIGGKVQSKRISKKHLNPHKEMGTPQKKY